MTTSPLLVLEMDTRTRHQRSTTAQKLRILTLMTSLKQTLISSTTAFGLRTSTMPLTWTYSSILIRVSFELQGFCFDYLLYDESIGLFCYY